MARGEFGRVSKIGAGENPPDALRRRHSVPPALV